MGKRGNYNTEGGVRIIQMRGLGTCMALGSMFKWAATARANVVGATLPIESGRENHNIEGGRSNYNTGGGG